MVELLLHFTIPLTILLALNVKLRRAILYSLIALLPDIDAIFLVHRSITHSALIITSIMIALLYLKHKNKISMKTWIITYLMLLSHLILDLFTGYTPILWPIINQSIWINTELITHIGSTPTLSLKIIILSKPTTFEILKELDAPIFTSEGLIISLLLTIPTTIKNIIYNRNE